MMNFLLNFKLFPLLLKIVGPAHEFYSSSLMFLAYTHVDDLKQQEKYELARDMALAAITGDKIYNFGEVLATPILNSLDGTDCEWLKAIVEALNHGNMEKFLQVRQTFASQISSFNVLTSRENFVLEKAVLLSIVNLVFERPSHDRIIKFSEIASACQIPLEKVITHIITL